MADIEDQNADLEISQVGGIYQSTLFELPNGRSGYILDLEIVNQSPRTIYGSGPPVLRFPWEDSFFDWLADPRRRPADFLIFARNAMAVANASTPYPTLIIFPAARTSSTRAGRSSITFFSNILR